MVILNYLLPIFFIIFSFGEVLKIRVFDSVSVGLIDLLLIAIISVWIVLVKKGVYKLRNAVLLFVAVGIFSLVINFSKFSHQEVLVSLLYPIRWFIYAVFYFVVKDFGDKNKLLKLVNFSGLAILILGFIQYFFYPSLKNLYYLGWDEHMFRLFSSFLDPNFTGVILVLFFCFTFCLRKELYKENKILPTLVLFLTFIAIILTYSRGAFLMFLGSALAYSIITRNIKIIAGAVAALAIVFIVLSPKFNIENTNLLRKVSSQQRIESSLEAIRIFEKNPLGVGFDTYRYARQKYGDIDKSRYGASHSGAGVDNSLILVLVTTGIPGLAIYLFLLYSIFKLGIQKKNNYGILLLVSAFGLLINSMTINTLFYSFIMIWLWTLVGITESS